MVFRDAFDAHGLRFPAAWEPGPVLRILLLALRRVPYRVSAKALPRIPPELGLFTVYTSARGIYGVEAFVRGADRAESVRRMKRLVAGSAIGPFVEAGYAAAGQENAWIRTRRSKVAGTGVFARQEIRRGTVIEDVTRPLVRYARVPKEGEPGYGHAIQVERGWWLLLDHSLCYFLNHCCQANVRLRIRGASVAIVAARTIDAGQELFLDYGTVAFRNDPYAFACTCGAKRCRGIVKGQR